MSTAGRLLSSGDVAEIIAPTGVTARQFAGWCERHLQPTPGAGGSGAHRLFSFSQALGIAIAAKVFTSERSCAPSYVALIAEAFARLAEEELLDRIGKRATHLMTVEVTGGRPLPVLAEATPDRINVWATYQEVKAAIRRMAKAEAPTGPGRRRGLALATKDS